MEDVRRYLDDTAVSYEGASGAVASGGDEDTIFLESPRVVDGRSSDTKSIGSLSQHLFESDDNEDEKYYGTCNGYSSHPGSKSNLLLCSECDIRSRTCAYRPQTPSHYGKFVEARIDQQLEIKAGRHQQDRRSSAISSILKSPMKSEGSTSSRRDEASDCRERRSKSISSGSVITRQQVQEQDGGRHLEVKSPRTPSSTSPVPGYEHSPFHHQGDQRAWTRRADQAKEGPEGPEGTEGRAKRSQESR